MELRAVDGARIADKTVLKMMNETGLRCGIRRETDHHRCSSCRGVVGKTFENVLGRDFAADGPWQKMGTDVIEFKLPFGKAYIDHWNHVRRQVKLKGLTPVEFREQALRAAA